MSVVSDRALAGVPGPLATARRIVVKVGSSLVTNEGRGVDRDAIGNWRGSLQAWPRRAVNC